MNITAIYRHYWPDTTPYARILRSILERAVELGHEAHVWTGQPCYNDVEVAEQPRDECLDGVHVHRFQLPRARKGDPIRRGGSLGVFLAKAARATLAVDRPDLVLVNCTPPIAMGLLVATLRRFAGVPYIYHCQDIHPEAMRQAGRMGDGALYRSLRTLDTKICNSGAAVVVLSEDMRSTMLARGVAETKLVVINNFALDTYDTAGADETVDALMEPLPPDAFIVLFAGNIGNFQGLDAVVDAAHHLTDLPDVHFVFMGSGLARAQLEQRASSLLNRTIHFWGQQSVEVARAMMARSHLGLVSLALGVASVCLGETTVFVNLTDFIIVRTTSNPPRDCARRHDLMHMARAA